MNRGRRGDDIFIDAADFEAFLALLQKSSELWGVGVSAYCLMSNHYHLLVQTPLGNLSRAMRHLNGVYTQYFNRAHGGDGTLFRGRYKSILVEEDSYLLELVRYIHRNPLRAGMVERVGDYSWYSHKGYLSSLKKWGWLHKDVILEMLAADPKQRIKSYQKFIAQDDTAEMSRIFDQRRLPAILGKDAFIDWVKSAFFDDKSHDQIPDSEQLAPDVEKIKAVVCQCYGVTADSLMQSTRGVNNEPRNVAIYLTRVLRKDGLLEISSRFGMQGYSSASSAIDRVSKRVATDQRLWTRIAEIKLKIISQKGQTET